MIYIILALLVAGWVFLTAPGFGKGPLKEFTKHDFAHRGYHDNAGLAPENSLKAFAQAVEAGYAIELDVQFTKDHQLVVTHDFDLKRNIGAPIKVDALTYEELSTYKLFSSHERIPLFSEVLSVVKGNVPLLVELKNETSQVADLCSAVAAHLDTYEGPFLIESFNPLVLKWFRKHRPAYIRGQLSMNFKGSHSGFMYFMMQHLMANFLSRPDFIAYDFHHLNPYLRLFKFIYRRPFFAYTIKGSKDYKQASDFFEGIIFDEK